MFIKSLFKQTTKIQILKLTGGSSSYSSNNWASISNFAKYNNCTNRRTGTSLFVGICNVFGCSLCSRKRSSGKINAIHWPNSYLRFSHRGWTCLTSDVLQALQVNHAQAAAQAAVALQRQQSAAAAMQIAAVAVGQPPPAAHGGSQPSSGSSGSSSSFRAGSIMTGSTCLLQI